MLLQLTSNSPICGPGCGRQDVPSRWDRWDALKRPQAETAAELDALLPAVLDRAFKGEL